MRRILFDAVKVYSHRLLYLTDIKRWNHEVDMYLSKGTVVMGSEPIHGWEPEEIEEFFHLFTNGCTWRITVSSMEKN